MSFNRVRPQGTGDASTQKVSSASEPITLRSVERKEETSAPSLRDSLTSMNDANKDGFMNKVVPTKMLGILAVITLVLGSITGVAGAFMMNSGGTSGSMQVADVPGADQAQDAKVRAGAVFGVPDQDTFSDVATGVLIDGGLDGEGSHTLLRPGGASQNVYLTSSVVDLDQFVNMEIAVSGETFKGQKAGWLMDVGRVEVKELKADLPVWYEEQQ